MALAVETENALMALIRPELFSGCDQGDSFAISNEDGAFAGRYEDGAVLAVVDVEIGGDVEDEVCAMPASVDVVLLLFNRVHCLHLE